LHLLQHRSLSRVGFVWFFGGTAAVLAIPLLYNIGTPVLWWVLPFMLLSMAGLWFAIQRSWHSAAQTSETLTIWTDVVQLVHKTPGKPPQEWQANPYWVQVQRHPTGGPVEHYLTLKGGARAVEIGTFLSVEERLALAPEITDWLRRAR